MRSQLPEHALVTLLRQCFITPRCQVPARLRQSAPRSSKFFHTARAYEGRLHHSTIGIQQRRIHTCNRQDSSLQTQFAPIGYAGPSKKALRLQSNGFDGTEKVEAEYTPRIAVLGGGITGLAAAYYITRFLPDAKITIYESSGKVGGWIMSKKVDVEGGYVMFEQGPRNLRPNTPAALVTLEMIKDLGLENELIITPKDSPAATTRFIYYPDHLVKMPGPGQSPFDMAWSILTEDIFTGLIRGSLFEFTREPRASHIVDESVGSFLNRRLGSPDPGNNIVSAVMHGIYAGDIYKLSAKSLLPYLWNMETTAGSLSKALSENLGKGQQTMISRDVKLQQELVEKLKGPLADRMSGASVYTFKGGLGALSAALEKSLRENPNVQFKLKEKITEVEYSDAADNIKIKTDRHQPPAQYVHCISTLPAYQLAKVSPNLSALSEIPYVTVMVVNLYYPDPHLLYEPGFGYLIPRSIAFDQNPECALGVVFDSYASVGQDTAKGTKVTVMLGGHWWDSFSEYPSDEEGIEMARSVLMRHLNINDAPEQVLVGLQPKCIPQYTVGHEMRLKQSHVELMGQFKGKLSVAGNWVDGVGLNDCVRGARDLVVALSDHVSGLHQRQRRGLEDVTGLEDVIRGRTWVQTKTANRLRMERELEEMKRRE